MQGKRKWLRNDHKWRRQTRRVMSRGNQNKKLWRSEQYPKSRNPLDGKVIGSNNFLKDFLFYFVLFFVLFLEIRVWLYSPSWPQTHSHPSSCLSIPSAEITGMHYHTWLDVTKRPLVAGKVGKHTHTHTPNFIKLRAGWQGEKLAYGRHPSIYWEWT